MHIPVVGALVGVVDLVKNIKNAISNDGKIDAAEAMNILFDFINHVTGIDLRGDVSAENVETAKAKLHI